MDSHRGLADSLHRWDGGPSHNLFDVQPRIRALFLGTKPPHEVMGLELSIHKTKNTVARIAKLWRQRKLFIVTWG